MGAKTKVPLQVRHVRDALKSEFSNLIDMSDCVGPQDQRDAVFLSRALAAKAARRLTGSTSREAAECVIDGRDDYGIDAIAISDSAPEMWLIQAKWSERGTAGCNTDAANKLVRGFKQMDDQEFGRFNTRFQHLAPRVKSVLADPRCRVVLVVALMGPGELSAEVEEIFQDAARDFNIFGRSIEHRVIDGEEFLQSIRDDIAPPTINLTATLNSGWHWRDTPYEAYYGLVSADELASWYEAYGDKLFARNVRVSLGLTRVNKQLVETLVREPQNFWYFNNGITVLCDAVVRHFSGKRNVGEPVKLDLMNASVVNGAQTVTSARWALIEDPEAVSEAYVSVRVIVVEGADRAFASEITEATNTQNHMERRDFIAIDEVQSLIQEDFRLSLNKEYIFKRGELDPPPEVGCSVEEAATALACAHRNSVMAMRAKRDTNLLWEKGGNGTYTQLFGQRPSAYQIWRSVQLLRQVGAALHKSQSALGGRARSIADHGNLLIAHLVFQLIGEEGIDDPDSGWESALVGVPQQVELVLAQLIQQMNKEFGSTSYVSSTFANEERCQTLVTRVLDAMDSGTAGVDLADYRPRAVRQPRRPNAVSLIVDAQAIPEGTRLLFHLGSETERVAVEDWLAADELRSQATWLNSKSKPLLWLADGKRYSPSGLTTHIWKLAEWKEAWVSVQGPKQWVLPGGETLAQLADQLWRSPALGDSRLDEENE